jgi:hypothetical protein
MLICLHRLGLPLVLILAIVQTSVAADLSLTRIHFHDPTADARPMVRWWWFGPAVTEQEIKREIGAMKAGGFGGFELQTPYPLATGTNPPGVTNLQFLSPEHLKMIGVAAREAQAAGLRMDLTLGSGWPYGGATTPIDLAAGQLRIEKGATPKLRDGEALIDTITTDGAAMSFIAGRTRMMVKRPAWGAEGFVVDHLDAAAVGHFLDTVGKPMVEACGPDAPYAVFCDSLECNGEDWTPALLDEFKRRRGYDLRPLLPALIGDDLPNAVEIRHDWGQTLTELFGEHFMRPVADFAHRYGSRFRIQAYGIPSAGQESYLFADLPEGEGYQWHGFRECRYATSAAHLMGVPVASSETFTWLHPPVFRATPLDMKAEANQHFLQGVNQLVCHGWPYSPPQAVEPGWSFYAAGVFNDHNPWWLVMPDVTAYLTRCSDLLRQGQPANDVALYLANDDAWAGFKPGHVSLTDGVGEKLGPKVVGSILDAGYGLDFFDDGQLAARGKVDGGALAFGDLHYRVVVLAGVERIPAATMAKLEAFVHGGGTLIATRSMPSKAPGYRATPADQQAVTDWAARLFGGDHPPALFVHDEKDLPAALASRLPPDLVLDPPNPSIGFVHRRIDGGDIYFIANTSNRTVRATAHFRAANAAAEAWNPMTGDTAPMPLAAGSTPIALDAYESTAVVFSTNAAAMATTAPASGGLAKTIDLSDGWAIRFPGDASTHPEGKLHSWTDDPATHDFSGVATYTRKVTVDAGMLAAGTRIVLGFGEARPLTELSTKRSEPGFIAELEPPAHEAAVVIVNGARTGSVWSPPYALDVTRCLHAGDNDVRIDVANTAVNSLAGGRFPNYDATALAARFGQRFNPAKPAAFKPVTSGLLGPITLTMTPP